MGSVLKEAVLLYSEAHDFTFGETLWLTAVVFIGLPLLFMKLPSLIEDCKKEAKKQAHKH